MKLLLAYGTVSQLGFMIALFGAGTPAAIRAGAALLLAHGAFKAALFLVVGIIDHQAGTRDLRHLSGLWRIMPGTFVVAAVSAASMAGLPPLLGFVAKEQAFEAYLGASPWSPQGDLGLIGPLALAGLVAGSALTVAYSARFMRVFAGRPGVRADVHAPTPAFLAPAALLAVASLVLGLAPELASPLVNGAASALDETVEAKCTRPEVRSHSAAPASPLAALLLAYIAWRLCALVAPCERGAVAPSVQTVFLPRSTKCSRG